MDIIVDLVFCNGQPYLVTDIKVRPKDKVYHLANKEILTCLRIDTDGAIIHEKGSSKPAEVIRVLHDNKYDLFPPKFLKAIQEKEIGEGMSFVVEGNYYMPPMDGYMDHNEICLDPKFNTMWKTNRQDGYLRIIGWSHDEVDEAAKEYLKTVDLNNIRLYDIFKAGVEYQKKLR